MSTYKKLFIGFLAWLLVLVVPNIVIRILFPDSPLEMMSQMALLTSLVVAGVVSFGLKSREAGSNFATIAIVSLVVGMHWFSRLGDPEADPRKQFTLLLVALIALNVLLAVFLKLRKRKMELGQLSN